MVESHREGITLRMPSALMADGSDMMMPLSLALISEKCSTIKHTFSSTSRFCRSPAIFPPFYYVNKFFTRWVDYFDFAQGYDLDRVQGTWDLGFQVF